MSLAMCIIYKQRLPLSDKRLWKSLLHSLFYTLKVGRKLLCFPPTRLSYLADDVLAHLRFTNNVQPPNLYHHK